MSTFHPYTPDDLHDPATCKRDACGRCRPKEGAPPAIPPNPHDAEEPSPRPGPLTLVPSDTLVKLLEETLDCHRRRGQETWNRSYAWIRSHNPPLPLHLQHGGGFEGEARSDESIENGHLDYIAGQYHGELADLTARLVADLNRLRKIEEVCTPGKVREPPVQAADIAGEGWCSSCYRDAGWLEPEHEGRYRGLCRFCGEWRAANGEIPPAGLVRWRHRNPHRRLTEQVVLQMTKRGA